MNAFRKHGGICGGLGVVLGAAALGGLVSCSSHPIKPAAATAATIGRQQTLLDADWLFHQGDVASSNEVLSTTDDDRQWQRVHLPHDYVLDASGSYSTNNVRNHGYLSVDMAWYRKHFFIPQADAGKVLQLQFDGIFRDSEVWLNGHWLGRHPSGYTPFQYDISKIARCGAENVITVRVDPRQFEGWWYEGGGIYRHVHYTAMDPVHVATWGTHVVSELREGDPTANADLTIKTLVKNEGTASAACEVRSEVIGSEGTILRTLRESAIVPAGGEHELVQRVTLEHPRLWSPESPQLYHLRTTIRRDGEAVDSTLTTFGLRNIRYDPDKGFFLNGRHVEIKGAANHHDFAGLGIAVPDSLQPWRVSQLKQMGCNAWRTAHNPPSEALLDACDRLGMLVMDENRHLGDSDSAKSPTGTAYTNLSELATMIQRDRNHPSIIMWSMCNEERLQGAEEGARIFTAMKDLVHRYDQSRPITSAMHNGWLQPGIAGVEDIIGVNYNYPRYDAIHERHPRKPMFGSEDQNEKTTRGEYVEDRTNGMCSSYNLSEKSWLPVIERPFMCGSFTWTGFDYRGEPNPYGWPDISNNTGLMDLCGFPKDKYYYFESCWSDKPMVHLVPNGWNWPGKEGQTIRVLAFSNARQVELFVNGKSLGVQTMPRDAHVEWEVPYQPGKLEAKASTDGKVVATDRLETTGAPDHIVLSPDRTTLQADGEDAVVIPVSILDAQDRLVPNASNPISFQLNGDGRILGVGNGDPSYHDSVRTNHVKAFHGHCIAVLCAGSKPGVLVLTASAPGLKPAATRFQSR